VCVVRDTDAAWLSDSFQAGCNINAVAKDIVVVDDDVADVDADTKFDSALLWHLGVMRRRVALDLDRASCCVYRACELNQHAVARGLDDTASMLDDFGINDSFSDCLQLAECALFVGAHKPAIAGDIRRHHSCQPPFHALARQRCPRWPLDLSKHGGLFAG
jgi:hypothetical protein